MHIGIVLFGWQLNEISMKNYELVVFDNSNVKEVSWIAHLSLIDCHNKTANIYTNSYFY